MKDGDRFKTNWIAHPAFGAFTYLYCHYYRAKKFDRFTSSFGSALMSTPFEYTIEDVIQPPTFHDMAITTVIGVPAYTVLEEKSYWIISTNSGFPYELVYVVNQIRIIVLDRDKVNLGPLVSGVVIIVFRW